MVKWNDENTKYLWGWEEKSEHLSTAIKNVKWYHCFCKTVWQFLIHSQILRSFFKKCKNSPNIHHVDRYILVYISIMKYSVQFSLSVVSDSLRPREPQRLRASLSITNSRSSPKPMSIHLVMPSNHLNLCHPLFFLPSIFPSIRVFSNESALHIRWPKYWSFSFSINPSNKHQGLISFRMDWLDLLAVQGTLKSFFSHTTVQKHQFFGAQLSL